MSVRRVNCPGCNAALNVPATMTNVKCSQCSTVWDVNNPPAAKSAAKPAAGPDDQIKSDTANGKKTKSAAAQRRQTAALTLVSGLFALLAISGLAVILLTGGDDPPPATPEQDVATEPREKVVYRIVKLPEATRKKIYYDYRLAAGSTVEKKVMIPKDSIAAKTLGKTMGAILDREITQQSIINKISEDDFMQIVAEGDDKGWPPQKKKKTTTDQGA